MDTVDLLRQMIRNECVNDGTDASGGEVRSVDLLRSELEGSGADFESYEPLPGRASLVGRIEGSDPAAPSMCWLGHTDVVPVNAERWSRDPFGGELVDGEVWGRGAVDMLSLTASMSVAFDRLARSGWKPRGTLVLAAVADAEALGAHGAAWLAEHEAGAVVCDYVITEAGGIPLESPAGRRLPVMVGEKGSCWCRLRVSGTPGHGSQPLRTDNALVTAAEVVRRLASYRPTADIHGAWRAFVESMGWPDEMSATLLDPDRIDGLLEVMPELGLAREAHACTHLTIAPTVVHGGSKLNVIPDTVEIDLDVRTLPGQDGAFVRAAIDDAVGDLSDKVEIVHLADDPSTDSPVSTPLWAAMERVSERFHPGAALVPFFLVGATDARFFRRLGSTAYGFGMFSDRLSFEQYAVMFHGDDERVDVDSLQMSTDMFEHLAREVLG